MSYPDMILTSSALRSLHVTSNRNSRPPGWSLADSSVRHWQTRIGSCLLPIALGLGAALALLLAASGSARPAMARAAATQLVFPACGATIQACINGAGPGDTIFIPSGRYTESLSLGKAVSLIGELSATTIVHAVANQRVITVTGAAVDAGAVISGLTFTGGQATASQWGSCWDGCGAGMLITGSAQPRLADLIFSGNSADYAGGGLYAEGDMTLIDVLFQSNHAYGHGGGLAVSGTVRLVNARFIGNGAFFTVGAASVSGRADISGSLFEGNGCGHSICAVGALGAGALAMTDTWFISNTANFGVGGAEVNLTATVQGGGFVANRAGGMAGALEAQGWLAVTDTVFLSNSAGLGGGLYLAAGEGRVVNTLFAANSARLGGAAVASAGQLTMLFNTITSATLGAGSAIAVRAGAVGITDTIIAGYAVGISQSAGSGYQDYNLFSGVPVSTSGGVGGGYRSLTGDPHFANPAGGDYHLTLDSDAIHRGIDVGVSSDFEGDPRPRGGFDIGYDQYWHYVEEHFLPVIWR
jgi:predicted outer membrane repeat protein